MYSVKFKMNKMFLKIFLTDIQIYLCNFYKYKFLNCEEK